MKIKYLLLSIAMFLLPFSTVVVQAQSAGVQELQQQLQLRDRVISELLQRVEALEQRVGLQHATPDTTRPQQANTPTNKNIPDQGSDVAPGVVVVEAGDAERALERSLTREGALLLPTGVLEFEPVISYARQEDSTAGFVTSGTDVFASETERNANNLSASLAFRVGLPWDSQFEFELPYRWREVESVTNIGFTPTAAATQSGAGLGDVRIGLAKTLLREGLWRPDLIGRLTWDTDTGETGDNGVSLGGGFHELQASITAIKRQDPMAFIGGLSYEHTFKQGQLQPGQIFSANFGSLIALSPETSVRFLLSAAYQDETVLSGRKISGSDRTIGTFVVGGSSLIAPGTLMNLAVGIGLTDDADDFSISVSLPTRLDEVLF